jgi:tRNA(Arg) A34 adenosine deaminase TadA
MIYTRLNSELASKIPTKITLHDEDMLERALGLAQVSSHVPQRLGAVIFKRNRIIGRGYNSSKSHPLQAKYNRLSIRLHAEIAAIVDGLRENPNEMAGASIAVARVRREGSLGCSLPCPSCLGAIRSVGIRRIVCYGADDMPVSVSLDGA